MKIRPATYILLLTAAVIAILTYNTPWLGDDIAYRYDYRDITREIPITNPLQIIPSLGAHYFIANGRLAPHFLVQLFCSIPGGHLLFALANAAIYPLFILLLCTLGDIRHTASKPVITATLLTLITFQTKLTPSCQISYIWSLTLVMLFIILFLRQTHTTPLRTIPLALLSLVAGNTVEAITTGIIAALVIWSIHNRSKITPAQITMLASFTAGTLIILLSPAAHTRLENSNPGSAAATILTMAKGILTIPTATYIMLAIIAWRKIRKTDTLRNIYRSNTLFINTWAALIALNLVIGIQNNRQMFGAELMAVIITLRILPRHTFTTPWLITAAAVTTIYLTLQTILIAQTKQLLTNIDRQYARSNDGITYANLAVTTPLSHTLHYTPLIYPPGTAHSDYETAMLERHIHTRHPGRPALTILPPFMEQYITQEIPPQNRIEHLGGDLYFIIRDNANPRKIKITRTIPLPGHPIRYPDHEVDMNIDPAIETPSFTGKYIRLDDYGIMHLSTNTIVME